MLSKKCKKIITIEGMNCEHCVKKVENNLSNLENVKKVKVNLKSKKAVVISDISLEDKLLKEVIENIGFKVKSIDQ